MYKFSLVFIFLLLKINVFSQLNYVQNEQYLHFYTGESDKSVLHLDLSNIDWLELQEEDISIIEKLGSYKFEYSLINKAKNIAFTGLNRRDETSLQLDFEYDFKRKKEHFSLEVRDESGVLVIRVSGNSCLAINSFSMFIKEETKAIFGGGIQFSNCNLKGDAFSLVVEENGIGRGDKGSTFLAKLVGASGHEHSTYAPIPFFITNNSLAYKARASKDQVWEMDFTRNEGLGFCVKNLSPKKALDFELRIEADSPLKLVAKQNTAERKLLPEWMYGYILGIQGGKSKVNSKLTELQNQDIKVKAIWIQDWVGKRQTKIGSRLQWDWRANESVYPDLITWIDSLNRENIKALAYINPYFVEGGEQSEEGIKNDYFVMNADGSAYKFKAGGFNAYMLDLSNEEARIWTKDIIKNNIIKAGFSGWMCDFGEWLPIHPRLKNPERLDHNTYPVEWVKLNWEAAQEMGKQEELFIFNRSAYQGSHNLPIIMWLGDQMSNFGENDGLASAVCAYNSSSLSGIPIVHSDIGGYTAIKLGPFKFLRNDELLKRWIEMEAFTPLWRSHEGLLPDQMSQIYQDEEMMKFFAYFDSIHQSLIPYFEEVNQELVDSGFPMVRHPFLLYPEDENTYNLKYEFFVGSRMLVCPQVNENSSTVDLYLPEGTWIHFFTGEVYVGGQFYTIYADLGMPAVFIK